MTNGDVDMTYHNGPVMRVPKVFLVFWGWTGVNGANNVKAYLSNFLGGVGGSSWMTSQTQYYQSGLAGHITNPTGQLKGTWIDLVGAAPTASLTPAQLRQEAVNAQAFFALAPNGGFAYDPDAQFVIATPSGDHDALFGGGQACAWHSTAYSVAGPIPFTYMPYQPDSAGLPRQLCEQWRNAGRLQHR